MAIYHFSVQVISRSSGRSATAAAAYRAGEKIVDERTGEIHDYTRKKGVDSSCILAPASAPDWVFNREKLWNKVESVERRKDSQLAREINVALPTELNKVQQLELVKEFVNEQFISQGMVADICCHDLDTHNPHAHIMLTMREIDHEGFNAQKNRDWNKKELLEKQREAWADHTNKALEIAGINKAIDHRSLEAQGIERIPQIHLGVAVNAMKKRGIATFREEQYLEIEAANKKIRKYEFHLELIDRLESIYRNNPEIESDLPIQKQTIKPPQTKQTITKSNHGIAPPELTQKRTGEPNQTSETVDNSNYDISKKTKKPEQANELNRLEQSLTRFQRFADHSAERLDRLKSNTESTISPESERKSESTEYDPSDLPTELETATKSSKPNPDPKSQSDVSPLSEPVTRLQYKQVIEIAAHFLSRLNSEVWEQEPDSSNYDLTTNRKNLLVIEAKDGRGEILRYQNGEIVTQQLTAKDLEIFQRINITSKHQKQIADTAARFLHLMGRNVWNSDQGSKNYNLMTNQYGLLTIEAKDGRGEILRRQNGKIVAKGLTNEDVERFKKIDAALDRKLKKVKSQQRNQGRGFSR